MKLVTYEEGTDQKLGAVVGDAVIDLAAASGGTLPATMLELISEGDSALQRARELVAAAPRGTPLGSVRLLARYRSRPAT